MNLVSFPPPSLGPNSAAETGDKTLNSPPEVERPSIVQQYLRIAVRWRYLILGTIVGCAIVALIITLLMTPQYTATSTIEISREADQVTEFQGVQRDTGVGDQEFYQTQYGLLNSRTLSERVAANLGLIDDPTFFERYDAAQDGAAFQVSGGRYTSIGRSDRQRIAGDVLRKHVSIEPTRLSRLVAIAFSSRDPAFSAKVANAWAENFIQTNLERKVQATSYGREQLQRQLTDYKERLDQSQRQLVAYASSEQIINLPQQSSAGGQTTQERSIVADDLAALNAVLSDATADRIAAEAKARQASNSGLSSEALANPAINSLREQRAQNQAEYQQLMVRFKPDYPAAQAVQSQIRQLDSEIAREESRVSGAIRSDYRAAQQREAMLRDRVDALKISYLDLRRRSIQYNIYQQEVDTNRALYDGLLQRFKEIGVAGGVGVNNVAIVDKADVPQEPSSPLLLVNLLISVVLGLGLGTALALIFEQMDEAITDPMDVQRRLGLPLLGTVPRVEGSPKVSISDRKSELSDAYLAVQTALGFATDHGVPKSFAVTSTRPAEGKSITSFALASTLTRSGRNVILLDGDMRSPSVHHLVGIDHDHGLSNYLSGDEDFSGMIVKADQLGFDAISAGPIPPNAAELLSGNRLTVLINRLLETYDHVIIDSPPVMGLADAPLIASHVEGVVYAVESHGIRSTMVATALGRLAKVNANIFGGVLTKFDARRGHAGYGYEYGYSYGREGAHAVAE